jgi:hypothetical protein
MKKVVICNIPMKEQVDKVLYVSDDKSLPVADRKVRYPICAFLQKTLKSDDELKVILLVKKDKYAHYKKNTEVFLDELKEANTTGAVINFIVIDTDFVQSQAVHEQLMGQIVDEIETGSHILVDTTFGPKDLPIVVFAALNFAEKFLDCTVDNIIYGQASFVNGKPVDTKICDMIPLYCLSSISNTIHCNNPENARTMLKSLLSL